MGGLNSFSARGCGIRPSKIIARGFCTGGEGGWSGLELTDTLLIHLGTCIRVESEFASGIKDMTFVLIYMLFICQELPFLIEFAGGFIMLSRGEEKRCDQSIITGDILAIRSSPKHSC